MDSKDAKSNPKPASPWSFRVATVAGIPIRIHVTFFLFLAWLAFQGRSQGDYTGALLMPAIFLCVVLHELGHALVAKRYGIQTSDITLYPIGGVAMLQGRPKPAQELWIALAGPLVNVAIAIVLGAVLLIVNGGLPPLSLVLQGNQFLEGLFLANMILPLFNMIPAFPMDGGRVLRAILGLSMPEVRATQIAGAIGQLLAIGLGFLGLVLPSLVLMLVAFFVFMGAGQEVAATIGMSLMSGHKVSDAMITDFQTLDSGQSVNSAADLLLAGSQQDFPVVIGTEVIGLLTRQDLIRGLATDGPGAYVSGHMQREFARVGPDEPLDSLFDQIASDGKGAILVFEEDRLVGMVTPENLNEFLLIEQARARTSRRYA